MRTSAGNEKSSAWGERGSICPVHSERAAPVCREDLRAAHRGLCCNAKGVWQLTWSHELFWNDGWGYRTARMYIPFLSSSRCFCNRHELPMVSELNLQQIESCTCLSFGEELGRVYTLDTEQINDDRIWQVLTIYCDLRNQHTANTLMIKHCGPFEPHHGMFK